MSYEQNAAAVADILAQVAENRLSVIFVQISRRFVRHDYFRFIQKGTSQRRSLPLARAEPGRHVIGPVVQAETGYELLSPFRSASDFLYFIEFIVKPGIAFGEMRVVGGGGSVLMEVCLCAEAIDFGECLIQTRGCVCGFFGSFGL